MDPYLIARWLHILSATVLFGTGIGTAFQMVWAMRGGRAEVAAGVGAGVVMADWLFTLPAGLAQPATGLWLAHLTGWSLTEPWLILTYALYLIALAAWLPVVWLQYRIRDLCRAAPPGPVPPEARRLYRLWILLGWPGFGALVAVFWLMVSRPVAFL
ncbi:DUF2269 family protein [Tabrizicola sp.]|jgi:uncharacterized membrane protein|uniref:DUF2269 family protein n=1 Tax=Tabrizicola sp. TaxID=2005166 RepID=UPI0035AF9134